jgi:hypothetical protein
MCSVRVEYTLFGTPSKPHENALINVKIGEDVSEVESSIGVRQGSCEGPILFLFIMQAAMETLTWPVAKLVSHTRSKGVTMGERSLRKRDASSFDLWTSLFADHCAIFLNSRAHLELRASFNHLRRCGLKMHIGVDTKEFKYLGSIIDSSLTSDADVDMRIKAATSAFGALKNVLTSLCVDLREKNRNYNYLVFSKLLYGNEVWCLRKDLFNQLRFSHNRCVRSMCRITMARMMKHRITSKSLFERHGVGSFDSYYNRRLLRWAGHVARMPMDRMPRKL